MATPMMNFRMRTIDSEHIQQLRTHYQLENDSEAIRLALYLATRNKSIPTPTQRRVAVEAMHTHSSSS